ncbi:MAG: vWA domain-containing protein, partial [Candidatus Levyibacteriota bacterium]
MSAGASASPALAFLAQLPRGKVAENVLHFVRMLRAAGLPVGPAKVIDALSAVEAVGIENRSDFREALAAVIVSRREHLVLFEQAFDLYWRNPRLLEKMLAALLPKVEGRVGDGAQLPARLAQAMLPPRRRDEGGEQETELDAAFSFSAREVLQRKDFASMTVEELAEVRALLRHIALPLPELPVRRTIAAPRGRSVDMRATLRRSVGAGGALAPLRFRARRKRTPPLVVLCDISGSMDRYARMLLHFLHAITNEGDRVHVLTFGTRLTNITRHLRHRDVDVALAQVAAAVEDWAGGTRIGNCLAEFNRRWSRRLLGQNAVVLLISDGLDADAGEG